MTQCFAVPSGYADGAADRDVRRAARRDSEKCARFAGIAGAAALGLLALTGCGAPVDGDAGGDAATLAGSPTESETPSPTPTEEPGGVQIDPGAGPGAPTPVGGKPWDVAVGQQCEDALAAAGHTGLVQVAQTADASGVTSFWSGTRSWVACDAATGAEGAAPALVTSAGAQDGFDQKALEISSTVVEDAEGEVEAVRYTAAGKLPWPVQEISYTFPDGHAQKAQFVSSADGSGSTWWTVSYTATDGVLVDPETDPATLKPVTVSIVGAAAEAFRLPWEDAKRG